ncbi:SCF ubiquitin ligase complex subunit cdc4 [Ciborinia camelliae]|nr:SCF ubiquitin ligase complex subunit cdc4 [Ciborinia camelliae]
MDPPHRPQSKHRTAPESAQISGPQKFTSNASPSPFTSNPKVLQHSVKTRRPSQTVSLAWQDGDDTVGNMSRFQVELADIIETKTVTTTTTTKRSYPPLLIQNPRPLDSLDAKEYPLAFKPTPPELTKFSYEIGGQQMEFEEEDSQKIKHEVRTKLLSLVQNSLDFSNLPNQPLRNPYPHRQSRENREQLSGLDRTDPISRLDREIGDSRKSLKSKGISDNKSINTSSRPSSSRALEFFRSDGKDTDSPSYNETRRRNLGLGMHLPDLPATPDMSEVELSSKDVAPPLAPRFQTNAHTPQSGLSQDNPFENQRSHSEIANEETFNGAVATPPVAESDLESSGLDMSFAQEQRPHLYTAAARNASLPSPGLSPTVSSPEFDDDNIDDSQDTLDVYAPQVSETSTARNHRLEPTVLHPQMSTVMDIGSMIDTFDAMPSELKALMMYQLSRRCSKKTLRAVAGFVNPALMCDFLVELPTELSFLILSYLDHKDLCRAAQVSKRWRNVIDSNETGWKELFDRDGFVLQPEELERAIRQGWAWQDPYGPDGYEMDLSVKDKSVNGEVGIPGSSSKIDGTRRARATTKRKRATGNLGSERAKRRATGNDSSIKTLELESKFHKSEGPISAASAAALAVPNPELGLPELRKLHLFKSLYRRHHFLRHSWTNRAVEPHHMAFKAHPSHVITCLQFDDEKILTGSDDTSIHVYDTKTGALRKKLEGHDGGVWALQYEGNILVSGSTDRSVRVWDIEKGLCTQVFHGHTSTVRCLQILMPSEAGKTEGGRPIMVPEQPLIITGSRDSQVRVWKLPAPGDKRYIQTGPPTNDADCPYFVRVLAGHVHSVRAIAAHQDTLVSGSYDCTVRVWKISTGEVLHRLQGHTAKVYSVVLDHKRNRCISGSMDTYVKVWSLETGSCLFTLEGHTSLVGLLDLRDDRLVSAAADSTLRIWDPESGVCKSTLSAHTGAITCFQHDGQKVISGSDRTLKMWDVKTGECIKDLLGDLSGVWQVKFDERRCVAAVQRDNFTFVEVLDFGASRDGVPKSERGRRILLPGIDETERVVEVGDNANP